MAPITQAFLSALLLVATIQPTVSAPVKGLAVRQLAGEGQALDSIFTDTDNAVGYGIEDAEENLASTISGITGKSGGSTSGGSGGPPPPPPHRRQLAGEGQALDSIFTDTDNAVGYGIEDAEDNLADDISSVTGKSSSGSSGGSSSGGSGNPPPPPPPGGPGGPHKRQADKICNGAGNLAGSLGLDAGAAVGVCDNLDGELTSGAANAGASIGQAEENTLEGIGSSIPKKREAAMQSLNAAIRSLSKRQADKICNGFLNVAGSLGLDAGSVVSACDNLDGELTSGAANVGASIGQGEESTLEGIGSSVP